MSKKKLGILAEEIAEKWLRNKGFKILKRNLWLKRYGEIDILAKKNDVFHFIEVKAGKFYEEFSPEMHFTKSKKEKIKCLANYFANKYGFKNFQVDLLSIVFLKKSIKIRFYKNIF